MNEALPAYAQAAIKADLLAAGVSGTIYALVMPETEAALARVVDGCDRNALLDDPAALDAARRSQWFDRYHEPWTQKQDALHEEYFDRWLDWAAPVVAVDGAAFPFRYPTAGASEGIYKLMAEHAAAMRAAGTEPSVHMFDGEYEGFPAFAAALSIPVTRHRRDGWADIGASIPKGAQFWISQPSAIDGQVWPLFADFLAHMAEAAPHAVVIPDLTYVGSVASAYRIALDFPNVPAFVISHSKPFGGYYLRVGGVFSRRESASLFGNRWFKNLLSLAWGVEMMARHDVFALPRRYRPVQQAACARVSEQLGIADLRAADVILLGIAPPPAQPSPLIASVLRGEGSDRVVRLCLTPTMTVMIDPAMAPTMAATLARNIA
ncbi:MAG: hypothetical protein ABIO86_09860 [Sphingomonas sp.]